jgi:hypothetical protein
LQSEMKVLAAQYKQKLEKQKLDKTIFSREQKLLEAKGPGQWAELRRLIRQDLEEFNAEVGHEAVSWNDPHSNRVAVSWNDPHSNRVSMTRKDDGVTLEGAYDEKSKSASFRSPSGIDRSFQQSVQGDDVVFMSTDAATKIATPHTTEQVATSLLRAFLGD